MHASPALKDYTLTLHQDYARIRKLKDALSNQMALAPSAHQTSILLDRSASNLLLAVLHMTSITIALPAMLHTHSRRPSASHLSRSPPSPTANISMNMDVESAIQGGELLLMAPAQLPLLDA